MRVTEVAGEGRLATAIELSRFAFPDGAPGLLLAAAGDFADALAAAPLAGVLGGPLLLVDDRVTAALGAEIDRLGVNEVVIVGGVGAVPALVDLQLEARGLQVRRVAGDGRADTAAQIARAVDASPEAAVTSADQFADALAFSPAAAAHHIPVLLSSASEVPQDTEKAIADLDPQRTYVVGGTGVISDDVARSFPRSTRLAGADRYWTSVVVADFFLGRGGDPSRVGIATGRDFPDGLAAGPALAVLGHPLLLVDGQDASLAEATYGWLGEHADEIARAIVIGGPSAISADVHARIRAIGRRS